MATQNKTQFIVDLVGNVTSRARQFGDSIRRFGADGSRSMKLFTSTVNGANGILDKFDNKLVGFVTGGGLAMAGKKVADHQQVMTELGTQYNLTADQVNELDAAISKVAAHRRLSSGDLTVATNAFLNQTNDFDAAISQLDNIALTIKGIGIEANTAGSKIGDMFNIGYNSPEKVRQWLDGIATSTQFGTGNITEHFTALPDMGKNSAWKSQEDQMQMLAIMRLANQEFDDPAQAASATKGFFEIFTNKEKQKILKQKGGISVKDKNGKLKSPADLLKEINAAAYNKERNLKDVFDGDTLKLAMIFTDPKKQNLLESKSNPANIQDGLMDEKATQNVQTFNGALVSLTNAGERFAQLKLAKPIQDLADAINDLTPEELDKYAERIEKAAMAIGAVVAARYAFRGGKKIYNFAQGFRTTGGIGGNSDGGLGGASGDVIPVYVTNWKEQGRSNGGDNGGSNAGNDLRRNVALKGATAAFSMLPFLDSEEAQANIQKMRDKQREDYPYADLDSFIPAPISNWMNKPDEAQTKNSFGDWSSPSGDLVGQLIQALPEAAPPADGKITIKIESSEGLTVRTKSVQSENVDLRVNTGYSGGNTY
ncbi:phage tail tape measure protein [Providencia huashanensis]|uniref:Phage tail tape measure protein n=1 Tax=Providencia huashanensis TaxID=3037798 RepID=A0ABT9ALS9_9GAMM|nr:MULTISPECIES: hypothetical protein [unclassified Providencia]MDO7829457.1 hypothetical protein [Providencia sp. CRE-138-0026]MDO7855534.1 hypothetical protein [Providencia sp. CRE-138-0111]